MGPGRRLRTQRPRQVTRGVVDGLNGRSTVSIWPARSSWLSFRVQKEWPCLRESEGAIKLSFHRACVGTETLSLPRRLPEIEYENLVANGVGEFLSLTLGLVENHGRTQSTMDRPDPPRIVRRAASGTFLSPSAIRQTSMSRYPRPNPGLYYCADRLATRRFSSFDGY